MLRRLLKPAPRPAAAAIPEGRRVYAVGDVHGRIDLLDQLVAMLRDDDGSRGPAETTMVFLGDVINRGPDSAQVVERLRELAELAPGVRFLKGNHEEVFLHALEGDQAAIRLFCRMGGRETAISYGLCASEYERLDYDQFEERLRAVVPPEHVAFVAAFEDLVEIGDYAFVHAGVDPRQPLAEQNGKHLRWIRERFLDHRGPLERVIVHGHTIFPEVDKRPNRIGIDTGAYMTGRLTALGLEGEEVWTVQT